MATTIKLKNSVTTTNAPSSLVQGEVAINITDKKVWVGNAATTPIQLLGAGASGTFGALTCTSLTNSGLTSGRVTYATTAGLLTDSANLTFNGTTLTASAATVTGAFAANGGATLGDASGDALTINSSAVSIPNGLNFDSNTLVIDATNNYVGIGMTPSNVFNVKPHANGYLRINQATTTAIQMQGINAAGTDYYPFLMGGSYTVLETGGAERMRIDSSGRVGIGETTPANTLAIKASLASIRLDSSTGTSGVYSQFVNTVGSFYVGRDSSTGGIFGSAYASVLYSEGAYPMVFYTTGTERMRITSGGDVGIGLTSPAQKLDVSGSMRLTFAGGSNYVEFQSAANYVGRNGTSGDIDFCATGGVNINFIISTATWARLTANGEFITGGTTDQGAYNLQCNGTGVWGAGAYVNGSDERIKNDIAPLDSGLDVVTKLNPVTYKYKEDWSKDQSTQTGFIAQELLTALDGKNYIDGVVQQGGQYMSVAYQNIIPILTKAIQEQQAMIEELKQEVAKLKGV